jgi:Lrp/AsnC family transcriptional regulator, leucine-responsive regulatory protein
MATKAPASAQAPAARALDRIDRRLLARLQQDGRTSVSQLAREVHLTVTPTLERVRRLESSGYIEGYFARLDPRRLGLGLLAYVEVSLDRTTPDAFDRFKHAMLAHDEVMECHMVAGGFDYLLKVRVRDMDSYRRFLGDRIAAVRGVQQTHTYFVMEEVKSTHRIIVPE